MAGKPTYEKFAQRVKDWDIMKESFSTKEDQPIRWGYYFLGATALWSLFIAVSLLFSIASQKTANLEAASVEARTAHAKDVVYRRWNSEFGGVYAPVTGVTQPNPYLDVPERDITTPSGKKLTKINPAYMTRQVHELAMKAYGAKGHITSLNPIRPANVPDPWETRALKEFQTGVEEVSSVEQMDGENYMRLMRPLFTEKSCIGCHGAQGYKIGDIRGGISVSVPMAPYTAIGKSHILTLSAGHGLLWLVGFVGIGFGIRRLDQQIHWRIEISKALRESENLYRTITESSRVGFWHIDKDGFTHYLNPAMCSILEIKNPEELAGKTYHAFFTQESLEVMEREHAKRSEGIASSYEVEIVGKRGGRRNVVISGAPLSSADGRLQSLIGTFTDISERKRAEEALRESERELNIRNRIAEIFLTSSDEEMYGRVLEVVLEAMKSKYGTFAYIDENGNRVVPSMTRGIWDKCEVLNKNIVFPRETWGDNLWARALIQKRAIASNGPFKVPDGHIPVTRALAVPIIHQGEAIGNFMVGNKVTDYDETDVELLQRVAVRTAPILHARLQTERQRRARAKAQEELRKAHDELERRVEERTEEVTIANELLRREIEVRKRSEEALTESQHRYKELWDDAPVAYHMLDTTGIIKQVNQTEIDMLGYARDEMVGKLIFDFILPDQRKEAEKRFRLKLEGEQVPKRDDRLYVKKDGSNIYVSIDDRLEYDNDGKLLGVRTTMVDVSERKQAEKTLRRLNRALQVLSDCNEAVIRATEELEFVKEVCRIIVQDGGYRLVWVGFAEQDDAKTVRPMGQWGFEEGYLKTLDVTWADTERGRGPTGKAIRTMKPSIAREIMTDPDFAPWRAAATKRGYASSIALPLIAEGRSLGALNIYAEEPDAFDTEEVNLLSNLADDLSYGIMALRAKVELEGLSSRLLEVQEDERKRLSRELHDSTGQLLATLRFGMENALDKMHHGTIKESIELLEAVIPLSQQASDEVRRIHTDLRPSLIDDLGIVATISWFCREFGTLHAGVRIEQMILTDEKEVPEPLKIVIFRILQEALNNVAKYSKADCVRIFLREKDGKLELAIEDNGQGFDVEYVRSEKNADRGVGLTSMKERAELSGGSCSIESSKGKGTTVRASWEC